MQIRHADGTIGEYDHLRHNGVVVKAGDPVKAGDLLGYSGNTGYSQSQHLHFMVFRAVDGLTRETFPIRFLIAGQRSTVEPVEGNSYTVP